MENDLTATTACPRDDIAAYVDGELSAAASDGLERHLESCKLCRKALLDQRTFLATLSASLGNGFAFDLPGDFTRKIVTSAESSVTGVRRPNELLTGVCIAAALLLFVLFAFSAESWAALLAAGELGEKLLAVGLLILRMASNGVFALAVVSRSIASYFDMSLLMVPAIIILASLLFFFASGRFVAKPERLKLAKG